MEPAAPATTPTRMTRNELLLLLAIVALGLGVRVEGLDRSTFAHPENYAPGWDDPSWVTAPPARRSTLPDVLRANLADGHPPLWFVAMLPWVKACGTGLVALRLPSALTGAACVVLLWSLVRRRHGAAAGLLAAATLALHGHHVFWSRMARMYAPACLLGLAATLLFLKLLEDRRRSVAVAYVGVAAALLWTQIYGFAVVLAHGVLAVATSVVRGRVEARAIRAALAAAISGAPVLTLAAYQNPPTKWADPAREHFDFAFGFFSEANFFGAPPDRLVPAAASYAITLAACALLLGTACVRARGRVDEPATTDASEPASDRLASAVLVLGVMAAQVLFVVRFGGRSASSRTATWATCAVAPLLAAVGPVVRRVVAAAVRGGGSAARAAARPFADPLLLLALLPWAVMAGISFVRPSFVARGAVLFAPYLVAAPAVVLGPWLARSGGRRVVAGFAAAATLTIAAASYAYFRPAQASPRDYRSLCVSLAAKVGPEDLLLVDGGYADPPLLYYLDAAKDRVVPTGAAEERFPDASRRDLWAIRYDDDPFEPETYARFGRRDVAEVIEVHRARAYRLPVAR